MGTLETSLLVQQPQQTLHFSWFLDSGGFSVPVGARGVSGHSWWMVHSRALWAWHCLGPWLTAGTAMGWHSRGGRGTSPGSCRMEVAGGLVAPTAPAPSSYAGSRPVHSLLCPRTWAPWLQGSGTSTLPPVSWVLEKPALPSPSSKATRHSWSCVLNYIHVHLTKLLFPEETRTKGKTTCNYTTYFQKYLLCIIICSPAKKWKCLSKPLLFFSLAAGLFSHIF